jgi:hypothetical protein
VSFAGSQTSTNQMKMTFGNGAIEVTAKGFTSKSDLTLIDAMSTKARPAWVSQARMRRITTSPTKSTTALDRMARARPKN